MSFESKFIQFSQVIKDIALSKASLDETLDWGKLYGQVLSENFTSIYRDDDLEVAIVSRYLRANKIAPPDSFLDGEIHVITEPYASGGHTRLMERIVSVRGGGDVLVARYFEDIKDRLRVDESIFVYHRESGYRFKDSVEVLKNYKTIFLHIHPFDLESAAAAGVISKVTGARIIFVNHADHLFSFGFAHADVVAEVSLFGMAVNQAVRHNDSRLMGIPLDEAVPLEVKQWKSGDMTILSGGSGFKFRPMNGDSFPDVVQRILEQIPNAKMIVIGPGLNDSWWNRAKKRYPTRLKVVPLLPYQEYLELMESVDVYIDSFPMSGGTALPEVRSKGKAITGLLTPVQGYTPWDAVRYNSAEELIRELKKFSVGDDSDILSKNNDSSLIEKSRRRHGKDCFAERLDCIVNDKVLIAAEEVPSIDINYYSRNWSREKKITFTKASIKFLIDRWGSGGAEVAKALVLISPVQFFFKVLKARLKKIKK